MVGGLEVCRREVPSRVETPRGGHANHVYATVDEPLKPDDMQALPQPPTVDGAGLATLMMRAAAMPSPLGDEDEL